MLLFAARRVSVSGAPPPAAGRNVALIDALHHQRAGDFVEELVVEPAHQPAHLDARAQFARHQPELAEGEPAGLVEIFGDDAGARHRRRALFDQNRRGPGRIERQKFLAPLPDPLLDEPRRQTVFFERQPHEAGMRADRMME